MTVIKELTRLVRPLRNGQITIPAEFRKALHLDDSVMLKMTLVGDELHIKPVKVAGVEQASEWLHELYDLFGPVRKQAAQCSEDEINADIDAAMDNYRNHRHFQARRGDLNPLPPSQST